MSTVIMRHPTLPPEQEIEVDAGAVPHHAAAGWQPVPDDELEARVAARLAALADQSRDGHTSDEPTADPGPESASDPETDAEADPEPEAAKPKRRTRASE